MTIFQFRNSWHAAARSALRRFACAAAVAATLAGCGEAPPNSPYSAELIRDNVFFSSFAQRPKHLDPVRAYSADEYEFIGQIYEPPLQYHYLKRPYTLVPLTAARMPDIVYLDAAGEPLPEDAPSELIAEAVYTIAIKPGIYFQPHPALAKADGEYRYHDLTPEQLEGIYTLSDFEHTGTREATAADFVYQIKRMADPRLHCPIAGIMAEHVIGFKQLQQRIMDAARENPAIDPVAAHHWPLAGVEVLDDYRFRIRLNGKYPQFEYWLAMPFFAPIPWEAERFYDQPGMDARNLNLNWYPIGTGAYMLTENNPNRQMVLEVNPHYHGEFYPSEGAPGDREAGLLADAGKPLPFIEKAVYTREVESIPYWNKFLQGYYDLSGVTSDAFDQAIQFQQGEAALSEDMRAKGIDLVTAVQTSIWYMGFNWLDPVVGGDSERARLLRQAISIAVDWEEFIAIFRNERGIPAHDPIPPGIFGHREGEAGINPVVYDWTEHGAQRKPIAAAREKLAAAGYPGGVNPQTGQPLSLYFDTMGAGPDAKALLNWMRKQFDKLGIQLIIRNTDYNRFQEKMLKGTAQIFMWGWNADYPDPENLLFLLYGPNAKVLNNGENAANYQNPLYDALFEKMRDMENGPERMRVIQEMLSILRRDAPWIFGYHPTGFSLLHEWYHNATANLMANNTLKYKRIDPQLRFDKVQQWNQPVLWPLWVIIGLLVIAVVPAFLVYRRQQRRRLT